MPKTSALWEAIQFWLDAQQFPPNQSTLAKRIGVQRSAVSDWKLGKARPTPEHLLKLSHLMEPTLGPKSYTFLVMAITADELFGTWRGAEATFRSLPDGFAIDPPEPGDEAMYGTMRGLKHLSAVGDTSSDAIAADEQESSIAGESEESDTP